jgi:hypothetical protein
MSEAEFVEQRAAAGRLVRQKVYEEEIAKGSDPRIAEARSKAAEMRARKGTNVATPPATPEVAAPAAPAAPAEAPAAPAEAPAPSRPAAGMSDADAAAVRQKVYEEEIAKGSDPRIAEARSKAAEMRARKGTKGPGG